LEASTLEIKDFLFGEVGPDLHWLDTWDVRSRLDPLSLCAFDAAFYVVVAEEELHHLMPFLVSVLHNARVCGGYRGFAALNNLGLALLLGDSCGSTDFDFFCFRLQIRFKTGSLKCSNK
jgi:hypothetical protein